MRDSYIVSRLRPHIAEFVAACMSYLPYFSYLPGSQIPSTAATQSQTNQYQPKDKLHPSETFLFLSALTNHLFSQPPLAQASLTPLLLPRLSEEWKAWVGKVDEVVNRQGGMFGSDTVRTWEDHKGPDGSHIMREIRDMWVTKVGWLVGRMRQHAMEEEL